MKNLFKSDLRTLTAAITLGTLSIGFAPAAMAVSTYDATASFSLTLTGVTDIYDTTTVTSGWSVEAFGDGFVDLFEFGDASASGTTSVVDPTVFLDINSGITQSSTASGTAANGDSWTDALTDLNIYVNNYSEQSLTFNFDYDITAIATATGDEALANATVDMMDDFGLVDIQAIADADAMFGPGFADDSQMGSFQITLEAGQFNNISGFVDSFGSASAVPVPAAVWLFGSGLLGLVGVARRKQAA